MSGVDPLTRDEEIDVVGLFAALKRRWITILAITLLTGAAFLVVLSLVSPRYESNARILIKDNETAFTRTTEDSRRGELSNRLDEQAVRSQVEIIASDKLALKIIDQLELVKRSEFDDESLVAQLGNVVRLFGLGESSVRPTARERALKVFRKKLDVYPVDQSRVIVIRFSSKDPKLAQAVPDALAQAYLDRLSSLKQKSTESATEWLGPETETMRENVQKAEAAVAEFRASSDILLSDNNNALLATQQLSEVSTELSRVKAERSSAQAKVASIKSALANGSSIDVIPEVMDSPLIQRLREREVALRAQISELSTTLLPSHPRLKALNSQVDDFNRQIRSAARNILISLENNVDLAKETEADLVKEINRLKSEAARVGEAEVELRALERKAAAARDLLQNYQSRLLEAESRKGFTPVDAEFFAPASLPTEPYFPKIVPYTIAGMVAALLVTVVGILATTLLSGAVVARERYPEMRGERVSPRVADNELAMTPAVSTKSNGKKKKQQEMVFVESQRVSTAESALSAGDVPLEPGQMPSGNSTKPLAATPEMGAPNATMEGEPGEDSVLAVRYAASVIADMKQARIAVTCPGGDPGSRSAWMLARGLAKMSRKTVLIDLSGGGVTSLETVGSKDLPGIFNLLSGSVTFDSIVFHDRNSSMHVIPAGTIFPGGPAPDLENMAEIVEAIAATYDFVVVDCGDADAENVKAVTGDDTIVIISGIGASRQDCRKIQEEFEGAGYKDILQIIPDRVDNDHDALTAA